MTNGCSNKPLEAHLYCTRGGGIGKPGKSSDFPKVRKMIEGKFFLNFLLKFLKVGDFRGVSLLTIRNTV